MPIARGSCRRAVTTAAGILLIAGAITACSGGAKPVTQPRPEAAGPASVRLHPAGPFYVGEPIPIAGYTDGVAGGEHRLVLQSFSGRRWTTRATEPVRSGGYTFPPQSSAATGEVTYRTVLYSASGQRLAVSNVLSVRVVALPKPTAACERAPGPTTCVQPEPLVEKQTVDQAQCALLSVTMVSQTRTVDWRWDDGARKWVQQPTPWTPVHGSEQPRHAGVADCVRVVGGVPRGTALPDLRIKDLTRCGKGDLDATGGTCFTIVPSAPHDEDFPSLQGRKLLKFPVITLNLGAGPVEILADRSGDDATTWDAYQSFYDTTGTLLGSVVDPAVEFYYAGDGHDHWHVRDFDGYELLDASGKEVARAEKHGYCMQDNTSYDPWQGRPRVSADPVYPDQTTCGKGLPKALTIIHGLSRGWGDTYPTSLPDQAIDITGIPDGTYTIRVHADVRRAVTESNERNNVATVKIRITGNKVSVVPNTSAGGIP